MVLLFITQIQESIFGYSCFKLIYAAALDWLQGVVVLLDEQRYEYITGINLCGLAAKIPPPVLRAPVR